jgi:hypothetical protein
MFGVGAEWSLRVVSRICAIKDIHVRVLCRINCDDAEWAVILYRHVILTKSFEGKRQI